MVFVPDRIGGIYEKNNSGNYGGRHRQPVWRAELSSWSR